MNEVIGQTIPLALGIAISPVPIIAAILMLLSPRAQVTSVGFLLGWLAGILAATTLFSLLSGLLPEEPDAASRPLLGTIQILLGASLLLLALRQWRGRPQDGEESHLPAWMQRIDGMGFGGALGLGLLLGGVNPKNLLLAASAGATIGSSGLDTGALALSLAVFSLLAGSTVLVPVIGNLLASDRLAGALDATRVWLSRENAVIMCVLLAVLGAVVIGKGIGSF